MTDDTSLELPEAVVLLRDVRFARFRAHLPASDDITLIALKGHLLAEEIVTDIIRIYCASPDLIDDERLTFAPKLLFATALIPKQFPREVWRAAAALNSLRNVLSHRLDSPETQKRLKKLFEHVGQASSGMQGQLQQLADDAERLRVSVTWILIALTAHEARAKEWREAGQ